MVKFIPDSRVTGPYLTSPAPPPPPSAPEPTPPPAPPPPTSNIRASYCTGALPSAETPKPKPPTPLVIPVKTGFSFLYHLSNILVTPYQRKSPLLVMNTL